MYSPELHDARLRVEGKVGHIYVTGAFVNGRRLPDYSSITVEGCLVHYGHNIVAVRTKTQHNQRRRRRRQKWDSSERRGSVSLAPSSACMYFGCLKAQAYSVASQVRRRWRLISGTMLEWWS